MLRRSTFSNLPINLPVNLPKVLPKITLLLALVLTANGQTFAAECDESSGSSQLTNDACIESGQWSLGIALGLGAQSNPLVDGDTIPLLALFDLAWYGEQAYFDNGELGLRWLRHDKLSFDSFIAFDRERRFFNFWDPANILFSTALSPVPPPKDPDMSPITDSQDDRKVSADDISTRRWAVLLGNRLQYTEGLHQFSFTLNTDISGIHKGQSAELSYRKVWHGDNWQFQLRPRITWKSDSLIDYYYGIDKNDDVPDFLLYEGKSGFQAGFSAFYSYRLSERWQIIVNAAYQRLNSGMVDSPLVEQNHTSTLFIGVGYRY